MAIQLTTGHSPSVSLPLAESDLAAAKPGNRRVEVLWQKMAEKLAQKQRAEFVTALKAVPCPYLNWRQRPWDVRAQILEIFEKLQNDVPSLRWGSAGKEDYNLLSIKDKHLVEQIVRQAPASQKDFYFLDVGAGDFQWSKSLAEYLNKLTGIQKDVTFHIIGVRGEKFEGEKVFTAGQCKLYNLGSFKVEELEDEFRKLGLSFKNKIDLAVERLCFWHLVEPVGTLAQVLNLLRPETGMALFLNFLPEAINTASGEPEIMSFSNLLGDLKAPKLTLNGEEWLVKRPSSAPCRFNLRYQGLDPKGRRTLYVRTPQEHDKIPPSIRVDGVLQGDRALYDWLVKSSLVPQGSSKEQMPWAPLYKVES